MPANFTDADAALLAKLRKRADKKAAKIAKREGIEKAMLPSEKTFYDALVSKSDRKSFRKMSAEERAAVVKAGKMPPKKKQPPGKDDDGDDDMDKRLADLGNDTLAKALKANRELEQRIEKMESDKALDIAKRDAKDLGLQESDGEMLMKARAGDKDSVKKLEDALRKMREQRDEAARSGGIFKEMGSNGGGGAKTALDELNALAADLHKREAGKLTLQQAFDKVMSDPANRELVAKESQERISKIQRAA